MSELQHMVFLCMTGQRGHPVPAKKGGHAQSLISDDIMDLSLSLFPFHVLFFTESGHGTRVLGNLLLIYREWQAPRHGYVIIGMSLFLYFFF